MEKLHNVMRSISENKGESVARRDHMSVFREFLDTLDRVTKQRAAKARTKATKAKSRRRR